MTESLLVSAQLAYVYPRLAELADRLRRSRRSRATLRKRGARAAPRACATRWTGQGLVRARLKADGSADRRRRDLRRAAAVGDPRRRADAAAGDARWSRTIRRFLGGVGAPAVVNGPSRIGSSLSPASNDPDVTERSQPPGGVGDNNANYVGGTWFDVNGWLTWSLGELDGVVPNARDYAWDEYTRNTLATHAARVPRSLGGHDLGRRHLLRLLLEPSRAVRQRPLPRRTTARSPSSRRGW